MRANQAGPCPLCSEDGGRVVWRSAEWRLVHAGEAAFPAFYRLICNRHVAEWSDLQNKISRLRQQTAAAH